ncbi:MAG: hypothetical protein GX052_10475 [Syntrophomonadaceae bacterium]|jgi:hypothetical protein|nr:hypothetical protein [Syntrophomonadaceae bacterium]
MKLTAEEYHVAQRVNTYFRSPVMSLRDKIFNAKLIALHDLELHNFTCETEREKLTHYSHILDRIMQKINA